MHFGKEYDAYSDFFPQDFMGPINPRSLFVTSASSPDTELSLSDNEQAVDLISFLDSESNNVKQEIIFPEEDNVINSIISPAQDNAINIFLEQDDAVNMFPEQDNAMNSITSLEQDNAVYDFLLSPMRARRNMLDDVGYGPTLASINANVMSMVSKPSNPYWVLSPQKSPWEMSLVQLITTPPSPARSNAWDADQHIKEEPTSYLTTEELAYLEEEQPEEKKTESDNVAGDDSADSYVDVELVDLQDRPMSNVMFGHLVTLAKRSGSLQARKKLFFAAKREARAKKPVGRPKGSKKKAAEAAATTGQASTSQFTPQPSCSTSNTEAPSASRCVAVGRKRKFKCETITSAQEEPVVSPPVFGNNFSVNFHDYAMSPLITASPSAVSPSSASQCSVGSSTSSAPPRRPYRRNASLDVIDKEKQNHHNQLERNRRQKLADLFTELRMEVPRIAGNPKASKVLILNEAVSHVNHLKHTDNLQITEAFREEQKQRLLTNQLQQLRAKLSSRLK